MSISTTTVELEFTNVVVNVPLVVAIPMYQLSDAVVVWGEFNQTAVAGLDYTSAWDDPVNPSYDSIIITPQQPLIDKIGAGLNRIIVRRTMPFTSDFDNDDAFVREKIVFETDRLWMGLQQVDAQLGSIDEMDEAIADANAAAAAAAASATAAAASATDADQSQTDAEAAAAAALASQMASANSALDAAGSAADAATSAAEAAGAVASGLALKADIASPVFTGNPTAPTPTAGDNDTSIATTAFVTTTVGKAQGWRNRIINGDFAIDQRNNGALVSVTGPAAGIYGADRWAGHAQAAPGVFRMTRTDDTTNVGEYIWTVNSFTADASLAATDYYFITQAIEGYNCRDFNWGSALAKTITISFEVSSNITGTFPISIRNAAGNRSWLGSFPVTSTMTRQVFTVPGDTTGTWEKTNLSGMGISIVLGAGSNFQGVAGWQAGNMLTLAGMTNLMSATNQAIYLRNFQVELGSVATEFERVPYDQQLARCKRYYQVYGEASGPMDFRGYNAAAAQSGGHMLYPVQMRANPTAVKSGTWFTLNCAQPTIPVADPRGFTLIAAATALGAVSFRTDSADDTVTISAEL